MDRSDGLLDDCDSDHDSIEEEGNEIIKFFNDDQKYGEFSNFWMSPDFSFWIDGKEWKSSEHYFQSMKYVFDGVPDEFWVEHVREAEDAKIAKERAWDGKIRGDWDNVRFDVMKRANLAKFSFDPLRKLLLDTGNLEIQLIDPSEFWGIGKNGGGLNMQGKMLMEVRDEIRDRLRGINQIKDPNSKSLKNMEKSIEDILNENGLAMEFAPDSAKDRLDLGLIAVQNSGMALQYLSSRLRNEKRVVEAAVCQCGIALQYCANENLLRDCEIVLKAVKKTPSSFQYADFRLRNSVEFLERVFREAPWAWSSYKEATEEVRVDPLLAKKAVEMDGRAIKFVMKMTRELAFLSVSKHHFACSLLKEEFRDDEEIIRHGVEKCGAEVFKYASESRKKDRRFVRELIENYDPMVIRYACDELRSDRSLALLSVQKNGCALQHLPRSLLRDKEIIDTALTTPNFSLEHQNPIIKNNSSIVERVISRDIRQLRYVGKTICSSSALLSKSVELKGNIEILFSQHTNLLTPPLTESDQKWRELFLNSLSRQKKKMDYGEYVFRSGEFGEEEQEKERRIVEKQQNDLRSICVSPRDLVFLRVLGRGWFGTTYLCRLKDELAHVFPGIFAFKVLYEFMNEMDIGEEGESHRARVLSRETMKIRIPEYHPRIASFLYTSDEGEDPKLDFKTLPDWNEDYWDWKVQGNIDIENTINAYGTISLYYQNSLFDEPCTIFDALSIAQILLQIMEGVHFLHQRLIVHRDLHEGNVFIMKEMGRVVLGDFGCALFLEEKDSWRIHERDGVLRRYSRNSNNNINGSMSSTGNYYSESHCPKESKVVDGDGYLNFEKCDSYAVGILGQFLLKKSRARGNLKDKLENLVEKMVKEDFEMRIGVDETIRELRFILS